MPPMAQPASQIAAIPAVANRPIRVKIDVSEKKLFKINPLGEANARRVKQ